MKVTCVSNKGVEDVLVMGNVYTVIETENKNRYLVNIFEGREDEYAPMYERFETWRFK